MNGELIGFDNTPVAQIQHVTGRWCLMPVERRRAVDLSDRSPLCVPDMFTQRVFEADRVDGDVVLFREVTNERMRQQQLIGKLKYVQAERARQRA